MKIRILIVVNADWYFWSHRLPLARALRRVGCDVIIAAAEERGYRAAIEDEGFRFIPLWMSRRSFSPWREARSLWQLFRIYRRERPTLVYHVTVKPVLYGSLVARAVGVPAIINAIPGLGYLFSKGGFWGAIMRRAALSAYRACLAGRKTLVIFQNPDDQKLFTGEAGISPDRTVVIRGVGVDIEKFVPTAPPEEIPIVLLASRLLWDKGVGELVKASRRLRSMSIACRVVVVGLPDTGNPRSIPQEALEEWQNEGVIEWWGWREDMAAVLSGASIVVLPSYSEGVPKILIEAAAAGRAIVTTKTRGCREIVHDGENGILVSPRDPEALAQAIRRLLLDPELRSKMGSRGRELAVNEFSEEQVIRETLAVFERSLGEHWPVKSPV